MYPWFIVTIERTEKTTEYLNILFQATEEHMLAKISEDLMYQRKITKYKKTENSKSLTATSVISIYVWFRKAVFK